MMKSKRLYFTVVLSAALFAFWGCPKKAEMSAQVEPGNGVTAEQQAASVKPDPATMSEMKPKAEPGDKKERAAADELKPIYFDFDQSAIQEGAKAVLEANAAWLRANSEAKIRIEGNCDDRGSKEYNLALGQRRAANVRKYLADLGIAAGRISLLSYGKEKPVCTQETEECMRKNRRGDVVVNESMLSAVQ
jgi:peptidoglycan-associated lipoprotein